MSKENSELANQNESSLIAFVNTAIADIDRLSAEIDAFGRSGNADYALKVHRCLKDISLKAEIFGFEVIRRLAASSADLLNIISQQNEAQIDETIAIIGAALEFLREILEVAGAVRSDADFSDEAANIIIIIDNQTEAVKHMPGISRANFRVFNPAQTSSSTIYTDDNSQIAKDEAPDDFFSTDSDDIEPAAAETENNFSLLIDALNDTSEIDSQEIAKLEELEKKLHELPNTSLTQKEIENPEELLGGMLSEYLSSSDELLESIERDLLLLEKSPRDTELIAAVFGAIHSLKGNTGFMGYEQIEEFAINMEEALSDVRSGAAELDENTISFLLTSATAIREELSLLAGDSTQKNIHSPVLASNVEKAFDKDAIGAKNDAKRDVQDTKAISQNAASKKQEIHSPHKRKDIRVDSEKVDKIFDLVGELITTESLITNHPAIQSAEDSELSRSLNMLNKISRELQEVSLQVRMTALEILFNKMRRVVRELAIKLNKQIEFNVSGAETEMDKNIIEVIADPLLHILRNAVDHGIELPEERIAAGKPTNGTVRLSADYLGNEIRIIVADDGRGINKEKVLARAIDKGIITGDEPLSDKDIFSLVLEAGLSTADDVTDISGRGVGMDVVKKNIEKLRGRVDIESHIGSGTKITLRIPLTLAIIDSMLVKVGNSTFAIPILSVKESVKAIKSQINQTMDGLEMMKVRGRLLPVIRLSEFFRIECEFEDIEQGIVMVCEARDRQFCIFADHIIGQQQAVVKSLTKYLGNIAGITGCMILPDGKIGLILDIEGLAEHSEEDFAKLGSEVKDE